MSSTLVDSILWEIITLHTNLVNKWLLREFRSRGAPPVAADMEVILKLSNAIDMIQQGGLGNAARDLVEILEYIIALPRFSIPEHFCKLASDCLVKVNTSCERALAVGGLQSNFGNERPERDESDKSTTYSNQDIKAKDALEKVQEDSLVENEDEEKDREWIRVVKDEREIESGEWDNVMKGDEEVDEGAGI